MGVVWKFIQLLETVLLNSRNTKNFFFVGLPHLPHLAIFLIFFSMSEPELGAGIDPGMALTLTISI